MKYCCCSSSSSSCCCYYCFIIFLEDDIHLSFLDVCIRWSTRWVFFFAVWIGDDSVLSRIFFLFFFPPRLMSQIQVLLSGFLDFEFFKMRWCQMHVDSLSFNGSCCRSSLVRFLVLYHWTFQKSILLFFLDACSSWTGWVFFCSLNHTSADSDSLSKFHASRSKFHVFDFLFLMRLICMHFLCILMSCFLIPNHQPLIWK